jgi:Ca2+-binding RTX toxin-like protein
MPTITTSYFPGNASTNEAGAILDVWANGSPLQGTSNRVTTSYVSNDGVLKEIVMFGSGFGTGNAIVNAFSISFDGVVTMQSTGVNEYLSTIESLLNQSVQAGSTNPLTNYLATYYDTNFGGSEGADSIVGWQGDNVISARGGNDTILGGQSDDQIFSGDGNDLAYGFSGHDIIGGGQGNDVLVGETGSDTLFGGDGDDILHAGFINGTTSDGGSISNVIWAGSGNDDVRGDNTSDVLGGGVGDDVISGNGGNDIIYGGQDSIFDAGTNDLIYGGSGNDTVYAGNGADDVRGGLGNDLVYGGGQSDRLVGEAGQDYLWGGSGNDQLYGGGLDGGGDFSRDVFAFQAGSGDDSIVDFELAFDYLDLRYSATQFAVPQDVVAASTQFSNGVQINLGGGDVVFLYDVTKADLANANYYF